MIGPDGCRHPPRRGDDPSLRAPAFSPASALEAREFLEVLCHDLPDRLDARRVVSLEGVAKTTDQAVLLLERLTKSRTAVYLGAWSETEIGEYPLAKAVEDVESSGGAAASVEPGELVYYKTEVCWGAGGLDSSRYLLVRDAECAARTRRIVASLGR